MFWGNGDEVMVEVWISNRLRSRVLDGDEVSVKGAGYYYDGAFFRDEWLFNYRQKGQLRIVYTDKTGDEGDGYEGSIEEAVLNADRYDR